MIDLKDFLFESLVTEGGNVFSGSSPIKIDNIQPTLDEYVKEFTRVFPVAKSYLEPVNTLGSVGKKAVSGDIDIAFDEEAFKDIDKWGLDKQHISELFAKFKKRARTASDDDIMKRAIIVAIGETLERESDIIRVDMKGSSGGTLFSQFPQFDTDGKENGEWVQIDTNFGNVDWLKFAYYSASYKGNVKGLHRTQLMLTLFSVKEHTFNHNKGIKSKATQETVADSPEKAVELLNELWHFKIDRKTLEDYFSLQEFLIENISEEDLHLVWDRYLKILDSTRCDIPDDLQEYWVENQERLGLTGKFLPPSSNLSPLRK